MTYRGGFVLARMEVCGTLWFVQVCLISNSHDSPLFKLLYGCYMDSLCSKKIFLFQAYSNLIRHLQLESCKMGKLPVHWKERKIKHHK